MEAQLRLEWGVRERVRGGGRWQEGSGKGEHERKGSGQDLRKSGKGTRETTSISGGKGGFSAEERTTWLGRQEERGHGAQGLRC